MNLRLLAAALTDAGAIRIRINGENKYLLYANAS
mgnify:CR=1 FL=1